MTFYFLTAKEFHSVKEKKSHRNDMMAKLNIFSRFYGSVFCRHYTADPHYGKIKSKESEQIDKINSLKPDY